MKIPQVSVFVSNRPGRLQAVCKSLADAGVNLLSLTLADSGEFGLIRLIVSDPEKAVDVLAKAGLSATITDVVACPVNAAIGGLAELLSTAVGSQQIDYMYAYPSTLNGSNIMILRFQDVDKAIEALKATNFKAGKNVLFIEYRFYFLIALVNTISCNNSTCSTVTNGIV